MGSAKPFQCLSRTELRLFLSPFQFPILVSPTTGSHFLYSPHWLGHQLLQKVFPKHVSNQPLSLHLIIPSITLSVLPHGLFPYDVTHFSVKNGECCPNNPDTHTHYPVKRAIVFPSAFRIMSFSVSPKDF
jgi:hypothetical protein